MADTEANEHGKNDIQIGRDLQQQHPEEEEITNDYKSVH